MSDVIKPHTHENVRQGGKLAAHSIPGALAPGPGASTGGSGTLPIAAADVAVLDAGGYFTATDAEAALQELAKKAIGYTAHGNTGSTETFDALTAWHSATLNANCTFTFTGSTSGLVASMILELAQDGTGSRTVTWPGSVVWPGGVAPTLSTTPAAVDILTVFSRDGGTTWFGFATGGSGSALTAVDFLVGTATGSLSAEIVVGTTPGGELGGTWGSPTVDSTHAGSSHAATQAAAEATAAAALAAHVATGGIGGHAHVVSENHLSNGSTTLYTLDQAFEDGSVIAWNTTTLARLGVTEAQPDQATVSAAGSSGDTIMFDYAATVV